MSKYLLTSITIAVLIYLTTSNEYMDCNPDDSGKSLICKRSGEEIFVLPTGKYSRLRLNLTNISEITPFPLETGINIDTLELSSSYPTSIRCKPKQIQVVPGSLDAFSEVHNLELNCLLFLVNVNPFRIFKSITNLTLKTVDINMFSVKYFADFPSLIELKLEDNDITIIDPDIFNEINEGLQKLIIIDKIYEIEPESFARFLSLKHLVLNGGQLSNKLMFPVFSGLNNLTDLDLNMNKITELHFLTFKSLSQLENLYLRHNQIRRISKSTFHGLKNLRKLDLAHNNLIYIDEGLFDDLQKLEYLSISSNRLSCISPEEFGQNSSLRTLDLSNNRITCLESNSFYGLHLETLTLMNNNLTELDSQVFANLHVKKLLDLRGNRITCMEKSAFQGLTAEQVLLCYQDHMTNVTWADQGYWGIAGNAIKNFIHNECDFWEIVW